MSLHIFYWHDNLYIYYYQWQTFSLYLLLTVTLLTVLHLLLTVTQSLLLASILTSTVYHLLLTLTQFKRLLQTVTHCIHYSQWHSLASSINGNNNFSTYYYQRKTLSVLMTVTVLASITVSDIEFESITDCETVLAFTTVNDRLYNY